MIGIIIERMPCIIFTFPVHSHRILIVLILTKHWFLHHVLPEYHKHGLAINFQFTCYAVVHI